VDPQTLLRFTDGNLRASDSFLPRGPDFGRPQDINDPMVTVQRQLAEKLKPYFVLNRAVSFPNCVLPDFGDQTLRVRIQTEQRGPEENGGHRELVRRVAEALQSIEEEPTSMIKVVNEADAADWLLRLDESRLELVEVCELPDDAEKQTPPRVFGLGHIGDEVALWLKDRFRRIFQAQNLLECSRKFRSQTNVHVHADMLRFADQSDREGKAVPRAGPITLHEGDVIAFQTTNRGRRPVDTTMLFIDSGLGIETLLPSGSVPNNRLPVGESVRTARSRVNIETTGWEHVVVIAIESRGFPIDFTFLEQPTIEDVRGQLTPRSQAALETPLGRLLLHAQYHVGDTRGLTWLEFDDYGFDIISWFVVASAEESGGTVELSREK